MCGIAGSLKFAGEPSVTERNVRQMLATIRHRGPDEFGIYSDEKAILGSARLSIIDLAGGQQPIANEDETSWIVFNGEIFNYPELRLQLERRGHRFRTNTDTEVLVHLYEDAGTDCLKSLNGQFAFAIWDTTKQQLFLARDRLGIRPLFYTTAGGTFLFASEIKALLAAPGVPAEIDPVSLDQVFVLWSTLRGRTIFRHISELEAGSYLIVTKNGTKSERRYWCLDFADHANGNGGARRRSAGDYLDEFRQLLIDATRIRLRADVPVGAYLSGGLDSSVVTALARTQTSNRLDTFSIAFSDQDFDESEFQLRMARQLGTSHHVLHATHSAIGAVFPEVIWHTETPVMRTAMAPMFLLSGLVREHGLKVVLTGEGADEFLGGYDIFKEAKVRSFWARSPDSKLRPLLLKRLYPDIRGLATAGEGVLFAFFKRGLLDTSSPYYSHAVRWSNNGRTRRFFSEAVQEAVGREHRDLAASIPYPSRFGAWGLLERSQYLESTIFLSQYLLSSQGDRVAMGHSVEGRLPYLDYRVVEFCNRLPADLKLHVLTEKYLLRLLGKEVVPEEIWRRRKRPYRAPIQRSFFNGSTPDYVRELLDRRQIAAAGLFRPHAVSQLASKAAAALPLGETDEMALTGIISAQLVHKYFVADFKAPPPVGTEDNLKICARTRTEVLR